MGIAEFHMLSVINISLEINTTIAKSGTPTMRHNEALSALEGRRGNKDGVE
jgi:hypothetical protein